MYINMLSWYNGTLQVIAGELFQRQDHFSHSKCKALFQVVHGYWHLEWPSNIFESSRTSTVTMLSRKRWSNIYTSHMQICIYIYTCVCVYNTYIPTYVHTYIHTYLHTYIDIYIYMHMPYTCISPQDLLGHHQTHGPSKELWHRLSLCVNGALQREDRMIISDARWQTPGGLELPSIVKWGFP